MKDHYHYDDHEHAWIMFTANDIWIIILVCCFTLLTTLLSHHPSVPLLNNFPISHLLWADDLILLALDAKSLQTQLDCLHEFVSECELSINIQKTNIMVFNKGSKLLNCSYGFKLGNIKVEPTRSYCYLGILSRWYSHELKNGKRI